MWSNPSSERPLSCSCAGSRLETRSDSPGDERRHRSSTVLPDPRTAEQSACALCCRRVFVGRRGRTERCAGGPTTAHESTPLIVLAEGSDEAPRRDSEVVGRWSDRHPAHPVSREQSLEVFRKPGNETERVDIIGSRADGTPLVAAAGGGRNTPVGAVKGRSAEDTLTPEADRRGVMWGGCAAGGRTDRKPGEF